MRMSVRVSKSSQTGIWRHNPHPDYEVDQRVNW
jgi:hypothetical protein